MASIIAEVSEYVFLLLNRYDYIEETFVPNRRECPFKTFEEAEKAYRLHCDRVASRDYMTLDRLCQDRINEFCWARGIYRRRVKKLRPRRTVVSTNC